MDRKTAPTEDIAAIARRTNTRQFREVRNSLRASGELPAQRELSAHAPINSPGSWNLFVSYTQRDEAAKTIAETIFSGMKDKGYICWLDVKMTKVSPSNRIFLRIFRRLADSWIYCRSAMRQRWRRACATAIFSSQ